MILKNLLKYRYRYVYVALSLVLVILTINNFWYGIIIPFYIYYLIKNHFDLWKIILVILVFYGISILNFNYKTELSGAQFTFKVNRVSDKGDYMIIEGKVEEHMVNVFLTSEQVILPGERYILKGKLESPTGNTIPNTFNYKNYLLSKKVKYIIYAESMEYTSKKFSINLIPYYIEKYIEDNHPYSKSYIKTFILANKDDFNPDLTSSINSMGISHLFAVSGLHIGILVSALNYLLSRFKFSTNFIVSFTITILILYMIATAFTPSITRASLMYFGLTAKNKYKIKLSNIDVLSIIFIGMLLINPYSCYSTGFKLSFYMTFVILLGSRLLLVKGLFNQLLRVSVLAFTSSFIMTVNLAYSFNLMTILYNVIFVFFMSVIVLPLGLITFMLPFFDYIYYLIIIQYNTMITNADKIANISIYMYFNHIIYIIIFLILIFFVYLHIEMKRRVNKPILCCFLVIIFVINSAKFDPVTHMYFLDVKGDATFVQDKFGKCNILIDTGESDKHDEVINFLLSKNVKKLDYLIISHFHEDHYGETGDLLDLFSVNNIISNSNVNEFHGENIDCGNIRLYIYKMNYISSNENDNSLILSLFISGKHYLFMGDSEVSREEEFMNEYSINPDYLKVSHHGSITSSSSDFINSLNLESAFIIVSKNNKHQHPSDIIISRYIENVVNIYRTDEMGTIEVAYFRNKEYKKFYGP